MAELKKSIVPVWVTDEEGYNHLHNVDGHYIISASAINTSPNKYILWDRETDVYDSINPTNSSPDTIKKANASAAQYRAIVEQQQLAQQKINLYADSTNSGQMNSFADAFSKALFTPKLNLIDATKAVYDSFRKEGWRGALTTSYDNSPFKTIVDLGKDSAKILNDYTIKPLTTDVELETSKAQLLLNNTLVNLSETVDYFTGANYVKGLVQGAQDGGIDEAVKRANAGLTWNPNTGRGQYDWNTGKAKVKVPILGEVSLADLGLEILSDPTNWITFGSAALYKTVGRRTVRDMLLKTADDVGQPMSKEYAEKLAKQITKYVKNTDTNIIEAVARIQSTDFLNTLSDATKSAIKLDGIFDTSTLKQYYMADDVARTVNEALQTQLKYLTALRNNAEVLANSKTFALLDGVKKIRGASDAVQTFAAKSAIGTSAAVLGYLPIVGLTKVVKNRAAIQEIISTVLNNFNNKGLFTAKYNITDVVNNAEVATQYFDNVMTALKTSDDGYIKQGIALASKDSVSKFANELSLTLNKNKPSSLIINDIAKIVADSTGGQITNLPELLAKIKADLESIHIDVRPLFNEIENKYNYLLHSATKEVVDSTRSVLADLRQDIKNSYSIPDIVKYVKLLNVLITNKNATVVYNKSVHTALSDLLNTLNEVVYVGADGKVTTVEHTKESLEALQNRITKTIERVDELYKDLDTIRTDINNDVLVEDVTTDEAFNGIKNLSKDFVKQLVDLKKNGHNVFIDVPKHKLNSYVSQMQEYYTLNNTVIEDLKDSLHSLTKHLVDAVGIDAVTGKAQPLEYYADILGTVISDLDVGAIDKSSLQNIINIIEDLKKTDTTLTGLPESVFVPNKKSFMNLFAYAPDNETVAIMSEYLKIYDNLTMAQAFDLRDFLERTFDKKILSKVKYDTRTFESQVSGYDRVLTMLDRLMDTIPTLDYSIDAAIINSGKLFYPKLPHRTTFQLLLNINSLQDVLIQIYNNSYIGSLITLGMFGSLGETAVDNAATLMKAAHDNYITTKLISNAKQLITDEDTFKAFLDVLSGKQRFRNVTYIADPVSYTQTFIQEMKKYIDRTHNAAAPLLNYPTKGADTLSRAMLLQRMIINKNNIEDGYTNVRNKLKYSQDGEQYFDIVYDMAPVNNAMFYEVTFVDHLGKPITFVNLSAYSIQPTEDYAKKVYGMSVQNLTQNLQETLNIRTANKQEEHTFVFAEDMTELAKTLGAYIKDTLELARVNDKRVRFIGYNNADESRATDRILNSFLKVNYTSQNIGGVGTLAYNNRAETVDVAQLYRAEQGAWIAPNSLVANLEKLFTNVSEYLIAVSNSARSRSYVEYTPSMVFNISADLVDSLSYYSTVLDNYINNRSVLDTDIIKTLDNFSVEEIEAMRSDLHRALSDTVDTFSLIKQTNNELSSVLIVNKELSKAIGSPNIMPYIDSQGYGLVTMNNPIITREWFDSSVLHNKLSVETSFYLSKYFQRQYNAIKNPLPLSELQEEIIKARAKLLNELSTNHINSVSAVTRQLLDSLRSISVLHDFVILEWTYSRLISTNTSPSDADLLNTWLIKNVDERVLYLLKHADSMVYARTPQYTPGISPFHSKYMQEDNKLIEMGATIDKITEVCTNAMSMIEGINKRINLMEAQGIHTVSQRAHLAMLQTYFDFYNSLRQAYVNAKRMFDKSETYYDKAKAQLNYTKHIQTLIMDVKRNIKESHNAVRINTILNMNAKDYSMFLYKYANGIQIFNMNANQFKNNPSQWAAFTLALKEAEAYGVRVLEDVKSKLLYVWIDKNFKDLNTLAEDTKKYIPKITAYNVTSAYNDFMDMMNKYTDNAYSLSMQSALTTYQFNDLLNTLPKEVRDTMLDEDYLEIHGMFTGKLNSILVGDYNDGAYDLFSNYSVDPLSNIASGFNAVFKKVGNMNAYKVMLSTKYNTLRYSVNLYKANHADVLKSIEINKLVPCRMIDGKLYKVDITNEKRFNKAIEDGTLLLDYMSYAKAAEVLNDGVIHSKIFQALNKYWLIPDKLAKLSSLGWMLRNIPESISKIWIQAGGDVEALTTIPKTIQYMLRYDRTSSTLIKETKGFINEESIADFFKKHDGDRTLLNKEMFLHLDTFFKSSSAAPTAQQIKQNKDIVGNLYRTVEEDGRISKAMVAETIKVILANNRDVDKIHTALLNKYTKELGKEVGTEIANILTRLTYLLPDWYKKPNAFERALETFGNNPFIKGGSYIESIIRCHAYLYFTEYTSGFASEGLYYVDSGQNNRSREGKAAKLMETVFPFSSFALHNLVFWAETANRKNSIIGLIEDIYSGLDDDDLDPQEVVDNYSLQWALLNNNIILDDSTGLTLKTGDAMFSALQIMTNPVDALAGMFHTSAESILQLLNIVEYNIPFYTEADEEYPDKIAEARRNALIQLIPLMNVLYTRYDKAIENYGLSENLLVLLFPSVFGITKTDAAGLTYKSRPIGYDWYNQSEEYKKKHKYVFGVSYIPRWLSHDPATYVDTYGRLLDMGLSEEKAVELIKDGFYIRYKDYSIGNWKQEIMEKTLITNPVMYAATVTDLMLRGYSEYDAMQYMQKLFPKVKARHPRNYYPKRSYVRKVYARKSYPKKFKRFAKPRQMRFKTAKAYVINPRLKNARMYPAAYRNVQYFGRRRLYKDNYAKYGASRMAMRLYSGANASAIKLARQTMQQRKQQQYRRF